MRKSGTGNQTWPLTSPLSQQAVVADGDIRFDMNDLPAKCPTGPLAYYVPALILTFVGALLNAGESPTPVNSLALAATIVKSVEVRDVWHGTPVSSNYWLGEHLRIHEFIGSGYQYAQRMYGDITPSGGGTGVEFSVRIPLSAGEGELVRETSQLALLYQPGSVGIVFKPASTLNGVSSGTTFAGTVRVSAELDARPELVLGTAVEHVLHRTVAAPSDPDVQIKGFGRSSKLTGVLPKGGVLALMELSNAGAGPGGPGLGGVFSVANLTSFSFDWRGQKITQDVRAYLSTMLGQMGHWPDLAVAGSGDSSERTTFPYSGDSAIANGFILSASLQAWIMVIAGLDCRLTDAQTADSDQTYHLDLGTATFSTGDHLIIGRYAKAWAEGKRADFEAQMQKGGINSLAAYVLGDGYDKAVLRPRAPVDKHTMKADELAFLPWQYIQAPAAPAA